MKNNKPLKIDMAKPPPYPHVGEGTEERLILPDQPYATH